MELKGRVYDWTLQAQHDARAYHQQAICTTIALVDLDENGERSFSFARSTPSAETGFKKGERDSTVFQEMRLVHFGPLALSVKRSAKVLMNA
ncbi:MAG: hypothetical protein LLF96_10835 [Eubacteriales bacterium]|nr:hypothetical protein [Eubacteriales bacterium]